MESTRYMVRLIDGKLYDPWSPSGPAPSPETVAYHLANLCRYGGGVKRFYSVAEHCLWVAFNLACGGSDNHLFVDMADALASGSERWLLALKALPVHRARLSLLGLVHDAPEGCGLVDVPGPILRHEEMGEYKRAHERCMEWLCVEWALPSLRTWPDDIKRVDHAILGAELPIRPVNAEERDGSDEDVSLWPNLDLAVRHDLSILGAGYIRRAWGDAAKVLWERSHGVGGEA